MNLLFHDAITVATLASGSRGNCTYLGDGRRGVLVDCGISSTQILQRLDAVGLGDSRIDAVLLTHEHTDHVAAARVLDDRLLARQGERVPFHLTRGTAVGMDKRCRPQRLVKVVAGTAFPVGRGWTVEPFTVPHDTMDPVGYVLDVGTGRACVITDLGRSTRLVEEKLASVDVAVVEFNHDVELLMEGGYPWRLKQRVRGPHGHLSNEQSAELVRKAAGPRLRHLVLAHLSQENNRPELAVLAAERAIRAAGANATVWVAEQDVPLDPLRVNGAPRVAVTARRPTRPARRPQPADDRQQSLFG